MTIKNETVTDTSSSSNDSIEEKLLYEDETDLNQQIIALSKCDTLTQTLKTKKSLLQLYLINLILYKKLSIEEQEFSPIKEKLIKLSILIEQIITIEDKCQDQVRKITDENEESDDRRIAPKALVKNKGMMKSKKREDENPRIKNRRKAKDLFERGKYVEDKNIDVKKTKTKKF